MEQTERKNKQVERTIIKISYIGYDDKSNSYDYDKCVSNHDENVWAPYEPEYTLEHRTHTDTVRTVREHVFGYFVGSFRDFLEETFEVYGIGGFALQYGKINFMCLNGCKNPFGDRIIKVLKEKDLKLPKGCSVQGASLDQIMMSDFGENNKINREENRRKAKDEFLEVMAEDSDDDYYKENYFRREMKKYAGDNPKNACDYVGVVLNRPELYKISCDEPEKMKSELDRVLNEEVKKYKSRRKIK